MDRLKIGMISLAHGHARSYLLALDKLPNVEIVGIADNNRERAAALIEKHDTQYYEDHHELLATDVDAVVICSENVYHASLVHDAAKAKKHILCEKPLGTTIAEMTSMIEICKINEVQLMTAFPCRYIPAVQQAKALIDRGELGEILAIKGTNRGTMPGHWFIDQSLSGGGAVLDHTVHVMDLMNWFLQSPVEEVYAETGTLFHDIDIDDAGMVHTKFENGAIAVLDPSWSRTKAFPTWGDVTMEILGTGGVLTVDALAQYNEIYSDHVNKAQWSYWGDSMNELMIADFVSAIMEGRPVSITGEDGMKSAAVAIKAYESAALGKPIN